MAAKPRTIRSTSSTKQQESSAQAGESVIPEGAAQPGESMVTPSEAALDRFRGSGALEILNLATALSLARGRGVSPLDVLEEMGALIAQHKDI